MNNERLAREFMDWYAANMKSLKRYVKDYDDDVFSDAFLRAYGAILRRGTEVEDYTAYFLRTYRAAFIDNEKGKRYSTGIEGCEDVTEETADADRKAYEEAIDALNDEIIDYVEKQYDALSVLLFKSYIRLYPNFSYSKMAAKMGITESRVKQRVGPIKKDVSLRFGNRKGFILAIV